MSACPICLEAELATPAACIPCGHIFCMACISKWTRSPQNILLPLCPQCRAPIRDVQKLFLSEWPVSSSMGAEDSPELSPWEQFTQQVAEAVRILSIPVHTAARYGPELVERARVWATRWMTQQVDRLIWFRAQLLLLAVSFGREWRDLGPGAQWALIGAAMLVVLLLVQDLQAADGIHRGVVLPIAMVIADAVKQVVVAWAYLLYRPAAMLVACGLEMGSCALDVTVVLVWAVLAIVGDVLCVPWLILCVAVRALAAVLSAVAGVVRLCFLGLVLALSLGAPAAMATAEQRRQIQEGLHAVVDWARARLRLLAEHQGAPRRGGGGGGRGDMVNALLRVLADLGGNVRQGGEGEGGGREAAGDEQREDRGEGGAEGDGVFDWEALFREDVLRQEWEGDELLHMGSSVDVGS